MRLIALVDKKELWFYKQLKLVVSTQFAFLVSNEFYTHLPSHTSASPSTKTAHAEQTILNASIIVVLFFHFKNKNKINFYIVEPTVSAVMLVAVVFQHMNARLWAVELRRQCTCPSLWRLLGVCCTRIPELISINYQLILH